MAEKLTRITLYPAPHVELRLHVTEQMIKNFKDCKGIKCEDCGWKDVTIQGRRLCSSKELKRWLEEYGKI